MKRSVSMFLLTAALLASGQTLVSCGEKADIPDEAKETQAQTETAAETKEDPLAARLLIDDGVPTQDYGGRIFRILACDDIETYFLSEADGEIVNDAIYQRTSRVEERFNIAFDGKQVDWPESIKALKNSVMGGDDEYQLFCGQAIETGGNVAKGYYRNWYDIPHVDFTKPWWPKSNIDDLTYAGKSFLAVGSFAIQTIQKTYCFLFNKEIAQNYDIPDMYETVSSGKWTVDMLTTLSRDIYRDLNGDGKADENDLYGYALFLGSAQNAYLWAFGEKLAKKQADGTIVMDYYNNRVTDIYAKLKELTFDSSGVFAMDYTFDAELPYTMFRNDQVLFIPGMVCQTDILRDLETDYGIIPYPKFDEAQPDYYTMVDGGHPVFAVPTTCEDPEFVGSVMEVLEAESWKLVVPAYYDVALKVKGTRDETSVVMLDYIFDHCIYDFGYIYGYWGAAFWPQYLAEKKSGAADIASYYEKNHSKYDKTMNKAFEFFDTYEG